YRLRHILVDEFQDTASTQFNLLERLVEGWAEHNIDHPQSPNTLFIVGDGMQSIYGFREANVGLFLGAKKFGINGLQLDDLPLSVNFRSAPAVVEWVNDTFSQAFPQEDNLSRGAVPFDEATAFKPTDTSAKVAVLGFTGDQARTLEAERTVTLVQDALQSNPEGSIAILVRSRSHLLEIIPALSRAGIHWNATDIDPLSNVSPIIDLLSLTKALLNLADRISWTALLRTPWVGLTNADLHQLLSRVKDAPLSLQSVWSCMQDKERFKHVSYHAQERLPVVCEILRVALNECQRLSVRSWVEGVWLQLGGAASLQTREEFTVIDDFFDLLESYQQGDNHLLMDEFEQAVDTLYAAPSPQQSPLQVMTIHKAKGLEFDTVILPGMARAARSDDKSLLMWREYIPSEGSNTEQGLVISPLGAAGGEEDRIYHYLRFEQMQSQALENTRLFYVAATRAVKQLYILFEAQRDEKQKEEIKPPAKNSLLHSAWPVLADSVCWHGDMAKGNEQIALAFDIDTPQAGLSRLPSDWQAPGWTFKNPLEGYYLESDYNNNPNEFSVENTQQASLESNLLARCVGTVTHGILEQLVYRGDRFWLEMPAVSRQQWLKNMLHHRGLHAGAWPQAIGEISTAINNTLADEKGRWILSSSHEQSVCEWALLACFPAKVSQRVIDRSFIDDEGVRWIIDYKTSQPRENESRQDFINRETELYRGQLTEYASYLSMKTHQQGMTQTIKTALYFTCYPHWQELLL
ncbi:MAG: UvrD-helicase domain-containing protein, partial [Spongiibacteraceae bacterium]|nr:UvrD-helicase domain-containing protein [Spongiibacteraceae bacterium]